MQAYLGALVQEVAREGLVNCASAFGHKFLYRESRKPDYFAGASLM